MTNPIITYWPNGNKQLEEYIVNGKLHRDPEIGPADICYDENGQEHLEECIVDRKCHRDPSIGPARIFYHPNGQVIRKEYWFNDKVHNPYGPAIIDYENNLSGWRLNGNKYTNEVNQYLDKHGLLWQDMDHTDFNIMWTILL